MDSIAARGARGEIEELLKKKLIQEYCRDPRRNAALGETAWQHCQETVRGALRGAIFTADSLCPDFCDRTTFLDASLSRAWEVFIKHICEFRELNSPPSLKAWLRTVAKSAACNERRDIIGRGAPKKPVQPPDGFPGEDREDRGEDDWLIRLDKWLTLLRERSSAPRGVMAGPLPRPGEQIVHRERRLILRALIVRYAQESPEDNESARFVRLWCWASWTMTKIAEHRFGRFETERERNTKLKHVSRELEHDFDKLRLLLAKEYGITSISQI